MGTSLSSLAAAKKKKNKRRKRIRNFSAYSSGATGNEAKWAAAVTVEKKITLANNGYKSCSIVLRKEGVKLVD